MPARRATSSLPNTRARCSPRLARPGGPSLPFPFEQQLQPKSSCLNQILFRQCIHRPFGSRNCWLRALSGILGPPAERISFQVAILNATVIALGVDRVPPQQRPSRIYIEAKSQSKRSLLVMFSFYL